MVRKSHAQEPHLRGFCWLLFVCLLAGSIAVAQAESVKVKTYRGDDTAPLNPSSVVVFDLSAADALVALGIPIAGAPQPRRLDYLRQPLATTASIGTLFEPDYEALIRMKPALIIAGGRSHRIVPRLKRIAPTIDMTIWGEDPFKQVRDNLRVYGRIFSVANKVDSLIAKLASRLARLRDAAKNEGRALILLTNGARVTAFARGSRFGWIHDEAGITPATETSAKNRHGEVVSFEYIAKVDPDWLLVVDRSAAIGQSGPAAKATLDNALVRRTKAWVNNRVVYLNSAGIYLAGGGPTSLLATIQILTDAFEKR